MKRKKQKIFPHPRWWKGLSGKEIEKKVKRFQSVEYDTTDVEFTHNLFEGDHLVAEVGEFEQINIRAGIGFLHALDSECTLYTTMDLFNTRYRLRWKRESPRRPIPRAGWWRGMTSGEFYLCLNSFGRACYDPSEFDFTHDLLRRRDGKLIGEAAEVESVEGDPSPWVAENAIIGLAVIRYFGGEERPFLSVRSQLDPYEYRERRKETQ